MNLVALQSERAKSEEGLFKAKDKSNPLTPAQTISPSFRMQGSENNIGGKKRYVLMQIDIK